MNISKTHNLFAIAVVALVALAFAACSGDKKAEKSNQTWYEESLNQDDSLRLIASIDHFFELVESGNATEAARSLYCIDPDDPKADPLPLDNEDLAAVETLLKTLPIVGHRIDYMKFRYYYKNEVKVTAILREATDDTPEAATSFYFKPVDIIGTWVLCMVDSSTAGQEPVVDNADRDSLTELYKEQQKSLEEAAKAKEN